MQRSLQYGEGTLDGSLVAREYSFRQAGRYTQKLLEQRF